MFKKYRLLLVRIHNRFANVYIEGTEAEWLAGSKARESNAVIVNSWRITKREHQRLKDTKRGE